MSFKPVSAKVIQQFLHTTAISLLSGILATLPARSADQIYFDYGPFGRMLPTSSLEAFAEDGTIDAELAPYLNRLPSEGQQELQRVLSTPIPALSPGIPEEFGEPFFLSQWLHSPIGESILTGLGQLIQTQGRQNGHQAMRAAIVLAAADPAGLSLINIIRFYPTGGLRLDLQEFLALSRALNTNLDTTERLVDVATQVSEATAATDPALDYSALPILAETGQFGVMQRSLMLQDNQRDRSYPVDLYLPDNLNAIPGPIPVMVLSHGYGDTRTNPDAVLAARTLAENGFVVAVPEHIGSNKAYQDDLVGGLTDESFDVMDFVNRPLDIRFLLDALEQLNSAEFQGRLQLDRVGLIGHSFGGYTALATAGATVDVDRLQQQCDLNTEIAPDKVNIGLLLQCRVLELVESPAVIQQLTDGSLADERVGLVIALAPVSNLFGEGGMEPVQTPVVIVGGASDIATPVALEQLVAFRGLVTPQKYLYLGENLSHSPALTELVLNIRDPDGDILDSFNETEELFSNLLLSLLTAHGKVHLLNDDSYRPYLTSAYIEAVNVEPTELYLLRSVPDGF